ncbi:cellulose binding domain-containing protein [Micromonospora coxensis]|uniref:cellulose binding domain-containing protein n=1 Tax=Micromonospora coxensis TaxID=356852 RepID=UPI0034195917
MSGRRHARSPLGGVLQVAWSPWIVVVAGVLALVTLQVVALLAVPGQDRSTAGPEPAPTLALPELPPSTTPTRVAATLPMPVVPGLSPRRTEPLPGTGGGTESPPPTGDPAPPGATRPPAPPPAPAPPAPSVTGRYSKLNDYGDSFIGEVLLTNTASGPRSWTVRLVLPRGRLVTSWVDGAPQGTARMSDGVFTYTSGVDLDGRSSVPLRFHFEQTGGANRPSSCTVDGFACSGL